MKKYIEKLINFIEIKKEVFFTFHLRPSSSEKIYKKDEDPEKNTAIIIQGPIARERSFTLETIKTYKKIFLGSPIILSTWDDEDVSKFKDLGIEIILNQKPEQPGISNINYQIISTFNGIKAAKKSNPAYILKTRTDQRIYNEKTIIHFKNLIKTFPIGSGKRSKGRIIGVDMNTFKYRPYSLSDMVLFGFTEDMTNYWDIDLDKREIKAEYGTVLDWSKTRLCEVYLSSKYLEKMGEKLEWSLSDSWKKYVEYFCIADRSVIDLYWLKYEKYREYRNRKYNGNFMNEEFDFINWLNLYNSRNFSEAPEHLLNKKIKDRI